MTTYILGISAFYHDSAACLVADGQIVAAAQEERFSRKKGDDRFPEKAVEYCLAEAGITGSQLFAVAYYDKPVLTFSRLLQSYLETPWISFKSFRVSLPLWLNQKLHIPAVISKNIPGFEGEMFFSRHHESHAASSFFCSPFEEAAIVVVDGVGEWACTSIGKGMGNRIEMLREVHFPHSLGLFYSAMTQYLGFKVNFDEYKVMGLAPYGTPKYVNLILDNILDLKSDGSCALNLKYFDFVHGLSMINDQLCTVTEHAVRKPESELDQFHMDFAASVQAITTEAMLRLARTAKDLTGAANLCLAGGVALNCVANGVIHREHLFEEIYIQPAAGDAGGAVGAALQVWYEALENKRTASKDAMNGAYLGPAIQTDSAGTYLNAMNQPYIEVDQALLPKQIAGWLAEGLIVGLCQGRMEFGPRALGARSVLGDPRDAKNQTRINLKIKYRESFRPFAPAVLEDHSQDFFEMDAPSPYMLMVVPIRQDRRLNEEQNLKETGFAKLKVVRSEVPAITHVDYSVRLQTTTSERNGCFWQIIKEFHNLTGCPMIVNTSFNLRGEPIVCDHIDAYHCFSMSDMDVLVLENFVVTKPGLELNYPEGSLKEMPKSEG
ncbi:MAG: hypothetical protein HY913_13440 [Desulfomonile tiedjei]|nr:hypothetical protein [Desulfomonile tiedjei]